MEINDNDKEINSAWHVHEDGTVHAHHGHTHTHTQTKAVLNRLSRAIGHLSAVKRMVEQNRDCSDVLIQLSAVNSAIKNVSKIILQDHIEHCLVEAVKENDQEAIDKLKEAIDKVNFYSVWKLIHVDGRKREEVIAENARLIDSLHNSYKNRWDLSAEDIEKIIV